MADVTISPRCSSLEGRTGRCHLSGVSCPFAAAGRFRDCPDCTFVAQVALPPDEFHVLVNAEHAPVRGTLPVRKCRDTRIVRNAAGVHVNSILDSDENEALLQPTFHIDGGVDYICARAETGLRWKGGRFMPL